MALIGSLAVPVSAQWPAVPTPNVPRTADGKPNLQAPAPRASDGKPDLSGIWSNPGWREIGAGSGVSGTGGAPGTPAVLPRGPGLFFNIGSGVPGGLPFQPWAEQLLKKRMADNMKDNPDAHCLPMGNMQLAAHPQPRKIIQTPSLIVILYEGNAGIRQIFTDGRPLPNNDPQPCVRRDLRSAHGVARAIQNAFTKAIEPRDRGLIAHATCPRGGFRPSLCRPRACRWGAVPWRSSKSTPCATSVLLLRSKASR